MQAANRIKPAEECRWLELGMSFRSDSAGSRSSVLLRGLSSSYPPAAGILSPASGLRLSNNPKRGGNRPAFQP